MKPNAKQTPGNLPIANSERNSFISWMFQRCVGSPTLDLSGRLIQIPKTWSRLGTFLGGIPVSGGQPVAVANPSSWIWCLRWIKQTGGRICACAKDFVQMFGFQCLQKVRLLIVHIFMLPTVWWLQAIWNIWVKLDHFPTNRAEHSKNLWVATTGRIYVLPRKFMISAEVWFLHH